MGVYRKVVNIFNVYLLCKKKYLTRKNFSKMTKKDMVARLVKEVKLSTKDATAVVNQFIIDFKDSLSKGVGSQAKFVGIGTWKVYERKATTKKNIKTKEIMFIPAKNAIQFKAGSDVKERVNTPENLAKAKESLAKKEKTAEVAA